MEIVPSFGTPIAPHPELEKSMRKIPIRNTYQHRGPAYQCREERHEAVRTFAARQADSRTVEVQEKVINDTENAVEADASQVQTNTAAEKAKIYMNDDQTDLKDAEKANNFHCHICDFRSIWEKGLSTHMSRKHANIEQLCESNSII